MTNWSCRFFSADYSVQPSCLLHANSWTTYMTIEVMAASPAVWLAVAMCPVVQKAIAKISAVPISRHVTAFAIALRSEMLSPFFSLTRVRRELTSERSETGTVKQSGPSRAGALGASLAGLANIEVPGGHRRRISARSMELRPVWLD